MRTSLDEQKARTLQAKDQPELLVATPPCTKFSSLQGFRKAKATEAEMREAIDMVNFAVEMCKKQIRLGKRFLFEHPKGAESWKLEG